MEELSKKIILTNIPNYYVTDENCENLYYKAMANGIEQVLIGPSSMKTGEKFQSRNVKTAVSIAYPSGTVCPEVKAQEITDCEQFSPIADMYFVTAAVGYFMSGHKDNLEKEMRLCIDAAKKPVYFITEAAEMSDKYLAKFCDSAIKNKIEGIVISTAFLPYDIKRPTLEDIKRAKKYCGNKMKVIAAGFYKSMDDIEVVLEAGADMVIVNEAENLVEA